jgi:hypothetical protein
MIKLAVFDIDNTLIPLSTHQLSVQNKAALKKLKVQGIKIAIATGRQFRLIDSQLKEIGFDYYICGNGAYILDEHEQVVELNEIDNALLDEVIAECKKENLALTGRYVQGTYEFLPGMMSYSKFFFNEKQLENAKKYMLDSRPERGPYALSSHMDEATRTKMEKKFSRLCFVNTTSQAMCDINLKNTNKGSALQKICKDLQISKEECIAFGDDFNDVSMFRQAGISIAMANADKDVMAAANFVADVSENSGVAKMLQEFEKKELFCGKSI